MKTDFSFKLVVAIIVAGVLVALASPTPKTDAATDVAPASSAAQ